MGFIRSFTVCVGFQVVQSSTLLRRDGPAKTSTEHLVWKHASERLKLLEEAYGGDASFYGTESNLFGTEDGDQAVLSQADAWDDEKNKYSGGEGYSPGTYGEITPAGMLKMLRELSVKPGQVFMDLGSGAGKFPMLASKVLGMQATGIELIERRHKSGCAAVKKLETLVKEDASEAPMAPMGQVHLAQGSFFDYDISNADVIFMDSVEWSNDMMKQLGDMCQGLKPGSRVLTWKDLPGEGFVKEGAITVPVTWDPDGNDWQIYKKVGEVNKNALQGKTAILMQGDGKKATFSPGDKDCEF
jgi:SAM-dependent methyltransferase